MDDDSPAQSGQINVCIQIILELSGLALPGMAKWAFLTKCVSVCVFCTQPVMLQG